jgi:hypothetical protein
MRSSLIPFPVGCLNADRGILRLTIEILVGDGQLPPDRRVAVIPRCPSDCRSTTRHRFDQNPTPRPVGVADHTKDLVPVTASCSVIANEKQGPNGRG